MREAQTLARPITPLMFEAAPSTTDRERGRTMPVNLAAEEAGRALRNGAIRNLQADIHAAGPNIDAAASLAILMRARELGMTLIDVANWVDPDKA